jgi:hypothetical protein
VGEASMCPLEEGAVPIRASGQAGHVAVREHTVGAPGGAARFVALDPA